MPALLTCPSCGASPSDNATRCDYCGAALARTACPSCFAAVPAGTQYCPKCGARCDRDASGETGQTLACPGCAGAMHVVRVGTTSMHECPGCAANWMESIAFSALCSSREERGTVVNLIGGATSSAAPRFAAPTAPAVRYVACPVCKKIMNRSNFAHRSGVVIDTCKGHGVWLEAGELGRVLAFIESGGLDRMRAEETKAAELAAEHLEIQRSGNGIHVSINTSAFNGADDTLIRRALEHLLF
jgi:Zn-finger nucleic acid-binding protein